MPLEVIWEALKGFLTPKPAPLDLTPPDAPVWPVLTSWREQ